MIRRSGNFGFIDTGDKVMTFNLNARQTWAPSSIMLSGGYFSGYDYRSVNGVNIIPYGADDDLPGYVDRVLGKFYAGEGIMAKKVGLQWGEGPRLFRPEVTDGGERFFRAWCVDKAVEASLQGVSHFEQMHRCLVDLAHTGGFWVKFTRSRGGRIGLPGKLAKVEHVPVGRVRFVYAGQDVPPTEAVVGDFPNPKQGQMMKYPLFNPSEPLKHAVSLAYFQTYSYNKQHYAVPQFMGAAEWLELAATLAPTLAAYNRNSSAVSLHIESPQSYWDSMEQKLRDYCERTKQPYTQEMLEKCKDEAMEAFAASMTGNKNAGKFMHTSLYFNAEANSFEGWKITPVDKKIKEYIDSQVAICRKAEAAATSGFGLDPALSNLILDTKLGSGSEKLYSLKVYNATETAIPDMLVCRPFQIFIDANFPNSGLRLGLYRSVVEAEKNVNPENRVKANA